MRNFKNYRLLDKCSAIYELNEQICSNCHSANIVIDCPLTNTSYCKNCENPIEEALMYAPNIWSLAYELQRFTKENLDIDYKDRLNKQNSVLKLAYYICEKPHLFKASELDINNIKRCVQSVFDELEEKEEEPCKNQCRDRGQYLDEELFSESEVWACDNCFRAYKVPIEIVRYWEDKQPVNEEYYR